MLINSIFDQSKQHVQPPHSVADVFASVSAALKFRRIINWVWIGIFLSVIVQVGVSFITPFVSKNTGMWVEIELEGDPAVPADAIHIESLGSDKFIYNIALQLSSQSGKHTRRIVQPTWSEFGKHNNNRHQIIVSEVSAGWPCRSLKCKLLLATRDLMRLRDGAALDDGKPPWIIDGGICLERYRSPTTLSELKVLPFRIFISGLLYNTIFFIFTVAVANITYIWIVVRSRIRSDSCTACGYRLNGVLLCPECGQKPLAVVTRAFSPTA